MIFLSSFCQGLTGPIGPPGPSGPNGAKVNVSSLLWSSKKKNYLRRSRLITPFLFSQGETGPIGSVGAPGARGAPVSKIFVWFLFSVISYYTANGIKMKLVCGLSSAIFRFLLIHYLSTSF